MNRVHIYIMIFLINFICVSIVVINLEISEEKRIIGIWNITANPRMGISNESPGKGMFVYGNSTPKLYLRINESYTGYEFNSNLCRPVTCPCAGGDSMVACRAFCVECSPEPKIISNRIVIEAKEGENIGFVYSDEPSSLIPRQRLNVVNCSEVNCNG